MAMKWLTLPEALTVPVSRGPPNRSAGGRYLPPSNPGKPKHFPIDPQNFTKDINRLIHNLFG